MVLLLQVFELLDTQNKGVIGPEELQEVVQQDGMVLENAQEDVMQLLQGIDIDGSNSLNYREFLAATMEASPHHPYKFLEYRSEVGEGEGAGRRTYLPLFHAVALRKENSQ